MIKGILYKYLLKALVIALLGLILFGVVPGLSSVSVIKIIPTSAVRRKSSMTGWQRSARNA
jgi:hypothetical protein